MLSHRKLILSLCASATCVVLITAFAGIAQQSAKEAPAGFNTPSFNSAASVSNGADEPAGDTFALDQQIYETVHDVQSGLGPVYNGRACAECHRRRAGCAWHERVHREGA